MRHSRFYNENQNHNNGFSPYEMAFMQDQNELARKSLDRQHRKYLQQQIQINRFQSAQIRANSRLMDLDYQKKAIQNFPFGKERVRIANYISKQFDSKQQEDNKNILQKFRREAINFRNNRHNRHRKIGSEYVTQNMLPGISANPSLMIKYSNEQYQKEPHLMFIKDNNSQLFPHHFRNANELNLKNRTQPIQIYQNNKQIPILYNLNPERSYINNNETQKFSHKTPSKHKHKSSHNRKYQLFKAEKVKQNKHFSTIQSILQDINKKIKQNSQILQNHIRKQEYQSNKPKVIQQKAKQIVLEKKWNTQVFQRTNSSYLSEHKKPKVQMTKNIKTQDKYSDAEINSNYLKTLSEQYGDKDKQSLYGDLMQKKDSHSGVTKIRQHLKLLKMHNHRLDYLKTIQM